MANWCASDNILNTTFSLITSVSNNLCSWKFTWVCFLTQKIQKWHRNCPKTYWFWAIGEFDQNLSFSIYLWRKRCGTIAEFFPITLFQISNTWCGEKMSLSSLFRLKRSNEGKNEHCHLLAFLIRHSFTDIKHYAKGSNKFTMCKSLLLLKFGKCRISK